eukprot:XP_008648686.1 uncharacterized protein LOC103629300 [Zea mays]
MQSITGTEDDDDNNNEDEPTWSKTLPVVGDVAGRCQRSWRRRGGGRCQDSWRQPLNTCPSGFSFLAHAYSSLPLTLHLQPSSRRRIAPHRCPGPHPRTKASARGPTSASRRARRLRDTMLTHHRSAILPPSAPHARTIAADLCLDFTAGCRARIARGFTNLLCRGGVIEIFYLLLCACL